jgi:deoxyribodipyrimidine photo-lyase
MTELNTTGFMHNRLRMIVATFLIFNLSIDWRLGERYFKSRLVDYDPEQNMGNWRWVAAMDTFSNDLYKTMSVDRQAERFDPDGAYRDKWLGKNWKDSDFDVAGTRIRGIKLLAK